MTSTFAGDQDLINFENDDTLHGKFKGFTTSGKVIWNNNAAEKNIAFITDEVRKIVLNKGKKTNPFTHISYATLKNLDIIPGKILSLEDEQLTMETDYGGKIIIPKDQLLDINVNPIGEKIIYRGPFSNDEPWKFISFSKKTTPDKDLSDREKNEMKTWKIRNFSLTHQGLPGSTLLDLKLPEKHRITFNSYSSDSYFPHLTLMADLNPLDNDENDKELKKNRKVYNPPLAKFLGEALIITLNPRQPSLYHIGFEENGAIFKNRIASMIKVVADSGIPSKTFYDVRVDKKSGLIMLFANNRQLCQWEIDSLGEKFTGTHYGFFTSSSTPESRTVISDIAMSSWNGIRDSALSLENETRDIVMLNNGTDRYSGSITSINNENIEMKSAYADLAIPHGKINSVNFARKATYDIYAREKDDITVRFYGTGKITGKVTKSDNGIIYLKSKTLGEIKIKSEYITSYEFTDMDYVYELP